MAESVPVTATFIAQRDQFLAGLRDMQVQAKATAEGISTAFAQNPIKISIDTNAIRDSVATAVQAGFAQGMATAGPVQFAAANPTAVARAAESEAIAIRGETALARVTRVRQDAFDANYLENARRLESEPLNESSGGEESPAVAGAAGSGIGGGMIGRMVARAAVLFAAHEVLQQFELTREASINETLDTGNLTAQANDEFKSDWMNPLYAFARLVRDPMGTQQTAFELAMQTSKDQDTQTNAQEAGGQYRYQARARAIEAAETDEFQKQKDSIANKYQDLAQQNIAHRNEELAANQQVHNDRLAKITNDSKDITDFTPTSENAQYAVRDSSGNLLIKASQLNYSAIRGQQETESFTAQQEYVNTRYGLNTGLGGGTPGLTQEQQKAQDLELEKLEARKQLTLETLRAERDITDLRAKGATDEATRQQLRQSHLQEVEQAVLRGAGPEELGAIRNRQAAETAEQAHDKHIEANDVIESTRQEMLRYRGQTAQAKREQIEYEFEGSYGVSGQGPLGGSIGAAGATSELGRALKQQEQAQLAMITPNRPEFSRVGMDAWNRMQGAGLVGGHVMSRAEANKDDAAFRRSLINPETHHMTKPGTQADLTPAEYRSLLADHKLHQNEQGGGPSGMLPKFGPEPAVAPGDSGTREWRQITDDLKTILGKSLSATIVNMN